MRPSALAPASKAILIADLERAGLNNAELAKLLGLKTWMVERWASEHGAWEVRKASHRKLLELGRGHQPAKPKGTICGVPLQGKLGSLSARA